MCYSRSENKMTRVPADCQQTSDSLRILVQHTQRTCLMHLICIRTHSSSLRRHHHPLPPDAFKATRSRYHLLPVCHRSRPKLHTCTCVLPTAQRRRDVRQQLRSPLNNPASPINTGCRCAHQSFVLCRAFPVVQETRRMPTEGTLVTDASLQRRHKLRAQHT
jgi:hypothetical protein